MREIKYIKQPTEYLCGQVCVAMIANVPVDDVIQVMHNDKGTGKKDIAKALEHYGITQAKTMTKADNSTPLPSVCILKVLLPKYSHWILYYYGKCTRILYIKIPCFQNVARYFSLSFLQ